MDKPQFENKKKAQAAKDSADVHNILQKSSVLQDRQNFPDAFANMLVVLNNGLDYISMKYPNVHSTIYHRIRLLHCEEYITQILNSRVRMLEGILARLHFCQVRRNASKNFWQWLVKRYRKVEALTRRPQDSGQNNELEKIKKKFFRLQREFRDFRDTNVFSRRVFETHVLKR